MREIALPLTPQDTAALSVGEMVAISGTVFSGREAVLRHLYDGHAGEAETRGHFLFNGGPLVKRIGSKWSATSVEPESLRTLEPILGELFGRCGFAGVIGAGGGERKVLNACRRYGAVCLQAAGGAGLALNERVAAVKQPHFKDQFDGRDALWELEFDGFPAVVTMDCAGRSLPEIVGDVSSRRFLGLAD
ncbi:MAG: fumarate hydratase C-terminal domain-containing protein [Planctomycetota bacterium]